MNYLIFCASAIKSAGMEKVGVSAILKNNELALTPAYYFHLRRIDVTFVKNLIAFSSLSGDRSFTWS